MEKTYGIVPSLHQPDERQFPHNLHCTTYIGLDLLGTVESCQHPRHTTRNAWPACKVRRFILGPSCVVLGYFKSIGMLPVIVRADDSLRRPSKHGHCPAHFFRDFQGVVAGNILIYVATARLNQFLEGGMPSLHVEFRKARLLPAVRPLWSTRRNASTGRRKGSVTGISIHSPLEIGTRFGEMNPSKVWHLPRGRRRRTACKAHPRGDILLTDCRIFNAAYRYANGQSDYKANSSMIMHVVPFRRVCLAFLAQERKIAKSIKTIVPLRGSRCAKTFPYRTQ